MLWGTKGPSRLFTLLAHVPEGHGWTGGWRGWAIGVVAFAAVNTIMRPAFHEGLLAMNDSDRLAIAIYEATIAVDKPFVPMTELDAKLAAEGVDCAGASLVLIQRGFESGQFGGAYSLSDSGVRHVRSLLTAQRNGTSL